MNWKKQWLKLKNKFGSLTQEDIDDYTEERNRKIDEENKDWMKEYKEKEINNQFRYLETNNKGIKSTEGKTDLFSISNLEMYLSLKARNIVHLIDICCDFENKRHIIIHWSM